MEEKLWDNPVKRKIIKVGILILASFLLLLLAMTGIKQYRLSQKHGQELIKMMIATDLHYLSPEYLKEDSIFHKPAADTDGKLVHYSETITDAFLAKVIEEKPKLLILSGDLTLNGSAKSHEELVEKLEKVQKAGVQLLVIPGNHDVNNAAYDYSKEEIEGVPSLLTAGFAEMYGQFGHDQALSCDEESFSYVYEATPYLRILMLDTNCVKKGSVLPSTLSWVEKELKDAKRKGAEVMMVSHQNLYAHYEKLSFGYQLYNAEEICALVEKYGVIANFSGHIHTQSIMKEKVPEIVTAAMSIHNTPYGEISYDGKALTYRQQSLSVSAYAKAQGSTDENLLDFERYAENYFVEVGVLQAYRQLEETDYSDAQKKLMAYTFGDMNADYFLGKVIGETINNEEGIAMWRAHGGFIASYIEDMLSEGGYDNHTIKIKLQ